MTTGEIDSIVHDFIVSNGAYPSPLGYVNDQPEGPPFPKSICASVNEVYRS